MSIERYFKWNDAEKSISFIDQTLLPLEEKINTYTNYRILAKAIKNLLVRGAPAIGIAGAYGIAIASYHEKAKDLNELKAKMFEAIEVLSNTRPTAVNLFWAIERIRNILLREDIHTINDLRKLILDETIKIDNEEFEQGISLGKIGAEILPDNCVALTHCNAGGLATGGMGSALSIFYYAKEMNKNIKVFVDETRPLLQGSRLTTWELKKWNIDFELICDNMAAHVLKNRKVNIIITGCDRVASNGDTANKIGTYNLAILAKYHNIPFYIASPISTIDFKLKTGEEIPIEERNTNEVTEFKGLRIAPKNINAFNPAFDVTPNNLITAFITEEGVIMPPFEKNLAILK